MQASRPGYFSTFSNRPLVPQSPADKRSSQHDDDSLERGENMSNRDLPNASFQYRKSPLMRVNLN